MHKAEPIAVADMSDVERVADALKNVQRAYYCPPYDPYMVQGAVAFAVAAKEASYSGIAKRIGWHTFRRTYSTLLRATGAELKVMQELMRHSTIRVTLDTYTQAVTSKELLQ
jgi:integrase